ncbi:MAG: indole-3-glycerol-phosphate synthase TrpC, partial [Halothiobacillaceae bacterium]
MSQSKPDILQTILARKREEIAERCARTPVHELIQRIKARDDAPRGFRAALEARIAQGMPA